MHVMEDYLTIDNYLRGGTFVTKKITKAFVELNC